EQRHGRQKNSAFSCNFIRCWEEKLSRCYQVGPLILFIERLKNKGCDGIIKKHEYFPVLEQSNKYILRNVIQVCLSRIESGLSDYIAGNQITTGSRYLLHATDCPGESAWPDPLNQKLPAPDWTRRHHSPDHGRLGSSNHGGSGWLTPIIRGTI